MQVVMNSLERVVRTRVIRVKSGHAGCREEEKQSAERENERGDDGLLDADLLGRKAERSEESFCHVAEERERESGGEAEERVGDEEEALFLVC